MRVTVPGGTRRSGRNANSLLITRFLRRIKDICNPMHSVLFECRKRDKTRM
jgi:hypothetical protein